MSVIRFGKEKHILKTQYSWRKWSGNSAPNSLDRAPEHVHVHVTSLAGRVRFSRQKLSKRTHILRIPSKKVTKKVHDYTLFRIAPFHSKNVPFGWKFIFTGRTKAVHVRRFLGWSEARWKWENRLHLQVHGIGILVAETKRLSSVIGGHSLWGDLFIFYLFTLQMLVFHLKKILMILSKWQVV